MLMGSELKGTVSPTSHSGALGTSQAVRSASTSGAAPTPRKKAPVIPGLERTENLRCRGSGRARRREGRRDRRLGKGARRGREPGAARLLGPDCPARTDVPLGVGKVSPPRLSSLARQSASIFNRS